MFSWIENATQNMEEMIADVTGEDIPIKNGNATDDILRKSKPLHYPFRLPITYLPESEIRPLSETVSQDLELVETKSEKSMYQHLFQPSHPFGEATIHDWKKQFTSNIQYLRDTQEVIQETPAEPDYKINYDMIMEIWNDTKGANAFFLEKYGYVEWTMIQSLNRSSSFLQILSIANIMSPAISLVIPVLFLLFPFLILKLRGIPITFDVYIDVLKDIAKHHFIGKALTNLSSLTIDKLLYLIMGAGFYCYQMYQNVMACIRFYNNITKVNHYMCVLREYIGQTIQNMEQFVEKHRLRPSYTEFCANTIKHICTLREYYSILEPITPVNHFIAHMGGVGYMLKCYYESYSNIDYEESLRYSFGFEGFLDNLRGISRHISAGHVSNALFDPTAACDFKDEYYPPHLSQGEQQCSNSYAGTQVGGSLEAPCIKNHCKLDKKLIITGPNASGKTTLLKATTINVIFTQQVGVGFYAKCVLNPYTHIHSYLNIPDTSERDSLFQAESRRCKSIIDIILANPVEKGFRHYGIFDELYSGTNPVEASKSAYAFLKYLTKFENVDFILTTHYTSVCSKLKKCEQIRNHKMEVVQDEHGNFEYTYKMKRGISKVQGAVKILESMNYPEEIMNTIKAL